MSVRLVDDAYIAELEQERSAARALEKLKAERKAKIHEAYLKLPNPINFPEGHEYRIPAPMGFDARVLTWHQLEVPSDVLEEYYTFVKILGRWAMTEEEMNRILYNPFI